MNSYFGCYPAYSPLNCLSGQTNDRTVASVGNGGQLDNRGYSYTTYQRVGHRTSDILVQRVW